MDREQVLKIGMDALLKTNKEMGAAHADRSGDFIERWHRRRDEHFARLVRNAALEEAAEIAKSYLGGSVIADAIDALKEPQP